MYRQHMTFYYLMTLVKCHSQSSSRPDWMYSDLKKRQMKDTYKKKSHWQLFFAPVANHRQVSSREDCKDPEQSSIMDTKDIFIYFCLPKDNFRHDTRNQRSVS